jgi:hypothetical protein
MSSGSLQVLRLFDDAPGLLIRYALLTIIRAVCIPLLRFTVVFLRNFATSLKVSAARDVHWQLLMVLMLLLLPTHMLLSTLTLHSRDMCHMHIVSRSARRNGGLSGAALETTLVSMKSILDNYVRALSTLMLVYMYIASVMLCLDDNTMGGFIYMCVVVSVIAILLVRGRIRIDAQHHHPGINTVSQINYATSEIYTYILGRCIDRLSTTIGDLVRRHNRMIHSIVQFQLQLASVLIVMVVAISYIVLVLCAWDDYGTTYEYYMQHIYYIFHLVPEIMAIVESSVLVELSRHDHDRALLRTLSAN